MSILDKKYFHFIGIGGIGVSGLAQILHAKGKIISGSDNSCSELTKSLQQNGLKIFKGHSEKNINKKHQLIIYSPAIPNSNPELQRAKKLKIPCLSYPEALGELSKEYYTIAISGTHGKSTTTALTSLILTNAGLDPTVVIGTKLREFKNRNFRSGKSKYLVIEACEYRRSFLNFKPDILVITNIEAEHLDYYKNLKDYQKAFNQLAMKVPKNGYIVFNSSEKNLTPILKHCQAKMTESNSLKAIKISPGIPGEFNIKNATNAAQVAKILNIDDRIIEKTIRSYKGSWRRLQYKRKKLGKLQFIDDYGHHPTEVRVTLAAIREKHPEAKILCVFQPHQYSRTKLLLNEFAHSFNAVDELIIPNIYKVRDTEKDVQSINTDIFVSRIREHQPNAKNGNGLRETANYINKNYHKFDIVVTMGAGDIGKIYKLL